MRCWRAWRHWRAWWEWLAHGNPPTEDEERVRLPTLLEALRREEMENLPYNITLMRRTHLYSCARTLLNVTVHKSKG